MNSQSVYKENKDSLGSKNMINRLINELMAYGMREYWWMQMTEFM